MSKISEINKKLAATRDHKWRQRTQAQIDGSNVKSLKMKFWKENTTEEYENKRLKELKKKHQDPEFTKSRLEASRAVTTTPEFAEANRKRNKIRDKKHGNKMIEAMNTATRKAVEIKEPGKDWKQFDSISEAGKYYDWENIAGNPNGYFPPDGSTYTGQRKRAKGWQFRRRQHEHKND